MYKLKRNTNINKNLSQDETQTLIDENKEIPPKEFGTLIYDIIYRTYNFDLTNMYNTVFGKKKVTDKNKLYLETRELTDDEKMEMMKFIKEIKENTLAGIFTLIENKVFKVIINGRDLIDICEKPTEHLQGWINHHMLDSLKIIK